MIWFNRDLTFNREESRKLTNVFWWNVKVLVHAFPLHNLALKLKFSIFSPLHAIQFLCKCSKFKDNGAKAWTFSVWSCSASFLVRQSVKCVRRESRFKTFWCRWARRWWSSPDGSFGKLNMVRNKLLIVQFSMLGFHPSEFSSWSPQRFLRWSRWERSSVSWENTSWPFWSVCSSTVSERLLSFSSWLCENCRIHTSSRCHKFWRQLLVPDQVQLRCRSRSTVSTTWASILVSLGLLSQLVQQLTWMVRLPAVYRLVLHLLFSIRYRTLRGCRCFIHRSITQHITHVRAYCCC